MLFNVQRDGFVARERLLQNDVHPELYADQELTYLSIIMVGLQQMPLF